MWGTDDVLHGTVAKETAVCPARATLPPWPSLRRAVAPCWPPSTPTARPCAIWALGQPRPYLELKGPGFLWNHEDEAPLGPWSPDGRHLGAWQLLPSGSGESLPVAWAVMGGVEVLAPKPRRARFSLFAWSPDGGRAVTLEGGIARVWGLPRGGAGRRPGKSPGRRMANGALQPSPAGSGEPAVLARDGGTVRYLGHLGGAVGAVAWSRDNRRLATAAADHTIKLWDRDTGRLLRTLPCPGPAPVCAWRGRRTTGGCSARPSTATTCASSPGTRTAAPTPSSPSAAWPTSPNRPTGRVRWAPPASARTARPWLP